MHTFKGYDAFVDETGRSKAPLADRVTYAALKLNGEAGEVAELVGKAMRSTYSPEYAGGGDLNPVKLLLELGDVLWYVARLAALHGYPLEDVAHVNREKLLRRKAVGKDQAGELEMATRTLETRRVSRLCNWCLTEPKGIGAYCSYHCQAEATAPLLRGGAE